MSANQGKQLNDTKENLSNKATNFSTVNDTLYPSVEAVKEQLDLKANVAQEAWITPTLLNGWDSVSPVRYMKDSMGFVHFKGRILGGADGSTSLTLPTGYRPDDPRTFVIATNWFNICFATVSNSGSIRISFQTITQYVDLSTITFRGV